MKQAHFEMLALELVRKDEIAYVERMLLVPWRYRVRLRWDDKGRRDYDNCVASWLTREQAHHLVNVLSTPEQDRSKFSGRPLLRPVRAMHE
jgi:hypothetical protein